MTDPSIFKAYDVRGIYPDQMDEAARLPDRARLRARAGRPPGASRRPSCAWASGATCACRRPRWPSVRARDRRRGRRRARRRDGRHGDALLDRRLARARRRADVHRLAQPEGLHRREAGQARRARPVRRLGHRRAARARDRGRAGRPRGRAAGRSRHEDVGEPFREAALGYIDPARSADEGGARRRQRHGRPDGRPAARARSRSSRCETYWEPDGEFPDHEPNPLLEENRRFIIDRVRAEGADLGIAWDGDADRCFFIDDTGEFVAGDFLTALLAESMLRKEPGATILYDVRASRAVRDVVERGGRHGRTSTASATRSSRRACARGRRVRRRGLRPLLLPRLLLRRLGHDPGAADPRAAVGARASA